MVKNIKQLKKEYKNEWLAIKTVEEKNGVVIRGKLIAHNPNRRELHKVLQEKNPKDAYITFAGPAIKPGYGFILCEFHYKYQ